MTQSCWPLGFSATGLSAGVAYKKKKKDMALFVSHVPASGAAVFTKSSVKAAPVLVSQEQLLKTRGRVRAIIVNSGSANAATGRPGLKDAWTAVGWAAEELGVPKDEVWISSTGVIGPRLRMAPYRKGLSAMIARIKKNPVPDGADAAEAILTTDTVPKIAECKFEIGGVPVRMWGCAKGSGMIHPVLVGPRGGLHATMLVFLMTDAAVAPNVLQRALERVTDRTYNCVSIDGDTSTNDFVALMANGASGAPAIAAPAGPHFRTFTSALLEVSEKLTTAIALDGEGASRMVQIFVSGARSSESARQMAAVIASSPLVKTACHGADPNWGRVLAAMGRSGVKFDLYKVKIWLGDILTFRNGREYPFSEAKAIQYLRNKRVVIRVDLGLGNRWSRYKTCDFTGQYVGINAGYRT